MYEYGEEIKPSKASGKVPTLGSKASSTEVYGFVLWMAAFCAYIMFLIWAFLPERILHLIGVTYYPAKWWALAVPSYFGMTFGFIIFFYAAYNLFSTNPLNSFYTITDPFAQTIDPAESHSIGGPDRDYSIPDICDIPIEVVNRLLHQAASPVLQSRLNMTAAASVGQPSSMSRSQVNMTPMMAMMSMAGASSIHPFPNNVINRPLPPNATSTHPNTSGSAVPSMLPRDRSRPTYQYGYPAHL